MATFEAKCPECQKEFQAEEDWVGQIGECPSCGKEITIQSEDMQEVVETPKTIQITLKKKPMFKQKPIIRQKQPIAKQEAIPPKDVAPAEPNGESANCNADEKPCAFCGETIKRIAIKCKHCQSDLRSNRMPNINTSHNDAIKSEDVLEPYWMVIAYGSVAVPFIGGWIIVFLSSILYYVWKKDYPIKASRINKHGWIAFFIGQIIGLIIWLIYNSNANYIAHSDRI